MKTIVILGPTATGKTDLAVALAKKFNGEIISADSRQIYQDMFLGVGKTPGTWQKKDGSKKFIYQNVSHYLIDFISPKKDYNVSHFKKDCQFLIKDIASRRKLPIICGGTGFWILSVVDNLNFPAVLPDKKLRKKLEKKTTLELFNLLKKQDPQRAKNIDPCNRPRLIRALEIAKSLGKNPSLKIYPKKTSTNFLQLGIDFPKEILDLRIRQRLEKRWQEGMLEEIIALKKKHRLSWKKIQSFGLAYFWASLFLTKKISQKEMEEKVLIGEKQYARRQRSWFKRDQRIVWENNEEKMIKLINDFLKK